jgi:hypothetical protein
MGNNLCRERSNSPMTTEQFNRQFTQPSPSLFGFTQHADTSLGFAPFIDDGIGFNLGYSQQLIHQPIDKLEQERNDFIQQLTKLMNKPVIETKVENQNPAIEEYTNTIKNLKGYLLEINERYDSAEKRYLENSKDNTEFESVKQEYSAAIIKIKSLNVLSPRTCVICFESEIEYFFDPCGHTICGGCMDQYKCKRKCHVCRVSWNKCNKLFL